MTQLGQKLSPHTVFCEYETAIATYNYCSLFVNIIFAWDMDKSMCLFVEDYF